MVAWLWFLSQTSDCRIFQNKPVPEIIIQIFQEFGFRDFRNAFQSTYEPCEVVVQYRESDFNFLSRLMEQAGIFYFFEHERGKYTLVMADNPAAHPILPGTPTVSYQPENASGAERDVVTRFAIKQKWRPGKYAMNDYNFELPSTDLEVASTSRLEVGGSRRYELYEYPGDYRSKAQGETLARIRLQELESISPIMSGTSTRRAMAAGYRFTLTGHDRQDLNQSYIIINVHHEAKVGNGASAGDIETYTNDFMAIPLAVPFRPLRLTPEPVVRGPETGVVVGPKGEEVFATSTAESKCSFNGTVKARTMKTIRAGFASPNPGQANNGERFLSPGSETKFSSSFCMEICTGP